MVLKCIIIEDEPASQQVLEKYISDCDNIELIQVFDNAIEASSFLNKFEVDFILLDINMPKLSGIDFLKSLSKPPLTIITTAYPEYAIEGFELDVLDYLLKPFPFERFYKATNKVFDRISEKRNSESISETSILLRANKKIHQVKTEDIYYLEVIGDYVKVYIENKHLTIHSTLTNLLLELPTNLFIRTHKSHAVNLTKIEYIDGNRIAIKDKRIPIGLTYKDELLKRLANQ